MQNEEQKLARRIVHLAELLSGRKMRSFFLISCYQSRSVIQDEGDKLIKPTTVIKLLYPKPFLNEIARSER